MFPKMIKHLNSPWECSSVPKLVLGGRGIIMSTHDFSGCAIRMNDAARALIIMAPKMLKYYAGYQKTSFANQACLGVLTITGSVGGKDEAWGLRGHFSRQFIKP